MPTRTDRTPGGWFAAVLTLTSCAHELPTVRFLNQETVWAVDDTSDVPAPPEPRVFDHMAYVFNNVGHRPVDDALAVQARRRASNVNARGEVPDSTWFTNRIGTHDLSPSDVARGPNLPPGPGAARPWTVVRTKVGGATPGLIIEDSNGTKYILKFDRRGYPEIETGADVVTQRLLWAAGYNVPEDSIVFFRREDLVVGTDAIQESPGGSKSDVTDGDVTNLLQQIDGPYNGLYRGLASRYLAGKPLGGYPEEGVRADDPNDLVRHEDRRDLRGQYIFCAWLAHTDIKEDNTLDMWVEDPKHPGLHYVQHYLVDFGGSLGARALIHKEPFDAYAHNFDYGYAFASALALGAWRRPWERVEGPDLRGVGRLESDSFEPQRFHSRNRYLPFQRMDRFDAFWASKILMRFRPEHIRAAVEQGRYSDARAVDYLTRTLIARQRSTGRHWFSTVNPLDDFRLTSRNGALTLCATDLWRSHGFDDASPTAYEITVFDAAGHRQAPSQRWSSRSPSLCAELPRPRRDQRYWIIRVVTQRGDMTLPAVWVHAAPEPNGRDWRIIGLWRT